MNDETQMVSSPANQVRPTDPVSSSALDILIEKARQYPRDISKCLNNAEKELEIVPDLAERAYYSIPYKEGGSRRMVEGLSIRAAMALARWWGNIATDGRIIGEDKSNYYVKGFCIDLETNIQNSTEVRVSKFYKPKGGQGVVPWNPDMMRNQVLSGISKARRNAVLMSLPEWVKDGYFQRAKELVIKPMHQKGPVDSIQTRIQKGKNAIAKEFRIDQDLLNDYLDEFMGGLDDESYLVQLKGLYNSLKEGRLSPDDIYQKKQIAMPKSKSGESDGE